MADKRGFTLIEVLVALTVFALIAALAYAAVDTAGNGFNRLSKVRDQYERSRWMGSQFRMDVDYATNSYYPGLTPLRIEPDGGGDQALDQLQLLVREPGRSAVTIVRYYLDESTNKLMRESRIPWARSTTQPQLWSLGKASSLSIEAMDAQGSWRQHWPVTQPFTWPRALRIRVRSGGHEREWILPVDLGDNGP